MALCLFALLMMLFSLLQGSLAIHVHQLLTVLLSNNTNPFIHQIIFDLRLPRTLSAFMTGGLLALAGALMQVLLRNPLADPYVLGVSSGAATGSLLCILFGFSGLWITGCAWIGSLAAICLVLFLSRKKQLLLTGIALASGLSALISFILVVSPDKMLRSMIFWLLGDLEGADMPLLETTILLIGLIASLSLAKELNIFTRGAKEAKALGMNTQHFQLYVFLLSSLLTASAVTLAGCIGFVGLIVPHLFRLIAGHDHRYLLPGCVLLGGSLLTLADTLARTLIAPEQLPVGMVMSLMGVPVFLFLLRYSHD